MKNVLKNLGIICLVVVLLTACGTKKTEEETPTNPIEREVDNSKVNEVETYTNVTEITTLLENSSIDSFNYGNVSLTLKNPTDTTIVGSDLKDILQYEITLKNKVNDFDISYSYKGILLSDLLDQYKVDKYTNIVIKTTNGSSITIPKKIATTAFLVFQSNGKDLAEWGPAKIVVPTYAPKYWLENVDTIDVR